MPNAWPSVADVAAVLFRLPAQQSTVLGRTAPRCVALTRRLQLAQRSDLLILLRAIALNPLQRFQPKGPEYRNHILTMHAGPIDSMLNLIVETLLTASGFDPAVFKSSVDGQPLTLEDHLHPTNVAARKAAKMKSRSSAAASTDLSLGLEQQQQQQPLASGSLQDQQQQQHGEQDQDVQAPQALPPPASADEHEFTQPTEGDDHQFIAESAYTHGHDDDLTHDEFVNAAVAGPSGGAPSAGGPDDDDGSHLHHDLSDFQHDLQQHLHHGGHGASDLDGSIIAQVMASYNATREAELEAQANGRPRPAPSSGLAIDASLGAGINAGILSMIRRGSSSVDAVGGSSGNDHLFSANDAGMEYVDSSAIDPAIDPTLAESSLAGPSGMAAFAPEPEPARAMDQAGSAENELGTDDAHQLPESTPAAELSGENEGSEAIVRADRGPNLSAPVGSSSSIRKKPYDRPGSSGSAASGSATGRETPRGTRKCKRCTTFDPEGAAACPGRHVRANCSLNARMAQGKVSQPPSAAGPGAPNPWDAVSASGSYVAEPTSPISHRSASLQPPEASEPAPDAAPLADGGLPTVPNALFVLPPKNGEARKARHCKVCKYHGRDGNACRGRGDRKRCKDYDAAEDAAGLYGRHLKSGPSGSGGHAGDSASHSGAEDGAESSADGGRDGPEDDGMPSSSTGPGTQGHRVEHNHRAGGDQDDPMDGIVETDRAAVERDATADYLADDDDDDDLDVSGHLLHGGHHHHAHHAHGSPAIEEAALYGPASLGPGPAAHHDLGRHGHSSHGHGHGVGRSSRVDMVEDLVVDPAIDPTEEYVVGDHERVGEDEHEQRVA